MSLPPAVSTSGDPRSTQSHPDLIAQIIKGGGEMGTMMRERDWSRTPLGAPSTWPQSLRTALGILLASRFPMYIAWGREFIQFYNDDYRPILGAKHPAALGISTRETFHEIWSIIGPMFHGVMQGDAVGLSDFLLPLERYGFVEECFFIFSYSPIPDESQNVGGVLVTCTETTKRVISERRMKTLHELAKGFTVPASADAACASAAAVFAQNPQDLPFTLLYLADPTQPLLRRCGSSGFTAPGLAQPPVQVPGLERSPMLARALEGNQPVAISDLGEFLAGAPAGPWPEAPSRALIARIAKPGQSTPYGYVIYGLSSRLSVDEDYRHFLELAASELGTAIATARAHEEADIRARELAELDRAKTVFFSNISHEFRTPLTLLLGPLEETLADQTTPLAPSHRQAQETAHRNALRLLRLVNTLLDFSRMEAGRIQASFRHTDIARLTADLASAFSSVFTNAGIAFQVECPPIAEEVYVDRDMWEKIVFNLLSNAFKFTLKGTVRLRCDVDDHYCRLVVEDTGTGIASSELESIFDRFHRVPNPQARTQEGSGIGLSLVKDLVSLHKGTVTAESIVGAGTRFTVRIPLGRSHLPPAQILADDHDQALALGASPFVQEAMRWGDQPAPGAILPASAPRAAPSAEVILLADDNADMRLYVERLLRPHWQVVAVADGTAALAQVRESPPDLVISDIMMPGMDGLALLRALREDPGTQQIPVLLLSARAGEESTLGGIQAGADDYLVKPFSARELITRVGTHLASARLRKEMLLKEQTAREELARSNSELEHFASVASHDLLEPLRMVVNYLTLLERRNLPQLDAPGQKYLSHALTGGQRMQSLIASLLDYAKVGRSGGDFTSVSLETVVADARANIDTAIHAAQAEISIVGQLPVLHGDQILLTQLMQNLLSNAIKYRSQQQVSITISVVRTDHEFIVSVQDNGVGIDPQDHSRLFRAFNRASKDPTIDGTGLGLATCKRIVDRHGGRIWVDSRPGAGSTFSFSLRPERSAADARSAHASALQGTDEHFRTMFMQAPASMAIFRGPDHVYDFANPRYLEMLGRASLIGKSLRQALPEIKDTGIYEIFDRVYQTGIPFVADEFPAPIQKDPSLPPQDCFFSWNLHPLRNRAGQIFGLIAVALEVTSQVTLRRRLESLTSDLKAQKDAVAESEKRFRQLANSMPQIVWMARPDGYLDYFNDRWYEITGAARVEGGDASWVPLVHPDDLERNQTRWYQSVRTGEPYEIESRLFDRRSGEYRWYLGRALAIRDEHGRIVRWFGTRTDIHDYRQTVEALRLSEQRLNRHARDLERSNAELEEFAYVAAHDLQEPIRMIISYMQLLERRQRPHLDDTARLYVSMVSDSATHMEQLIHSLLEYGRIGRDSDGIGLVDTRTAIEAALTNLDSVIAQEHAVIEIGELPAIQGRAADVTRLFQNLISNGIKFRHLQPPHIVIAASSAHGRVRFSVRDNGLGIDAQEGQRLFRMFQRLHPRHRYGGTGIGLASCKKIMEQYGGRIWFESQGAGTTFFIEWPEVAHA